MADNQETARHKLGVDIGGTFTDATLWNEATGSSYTAKVPSTPTHPAEGFVTAAQRVLDVAGVSPSSVELVVHGTTVVTNALIEGRTAKTAFVTTAGFRDMLEIARQIRPSLYDLQFEKPKPLVPRDLCFEVDERLDADGAVIRALDIGDVERIAKQLDIVGVDAVAICFLHSYANKDHEERTAAILQEQLPDARISTSAGICPEFREYFRASTTVVNAAIRPVVEQYLHAISGQLREQGFLADLLVMQSNGGVASFDDAGERPVYMVESGPAAGVIAATYVAEQVGFSDLITFDMGGTTAKTALVRERQPQETKDYEVGAQATGGQGGMTRGGGYPIRTPVIDLAEIGAGGGSIAWVDSGGALRVGPHSAGADPGPACYGKGGLKPTVTDANLVLGRLDAENFLGGAMPLDTSGAYKSIETHCARPLEMDVVSAAEGIIEIANHAMSQAVDLISVQRGYDPRQFGLVAFGGAGPLHANRIATELKIPTILIPPSPGTASALGLLSTDLRHDYTQTVRQQLDHAEPVHLQTAFESLERDARHALTRDRIPEGRMRFERFLELRYAGQGHELTLPAPDTWDEDTLPATAEAFHEAHHRRYGHSDRAEPIVAVNLRLIALGEIDKPRLQPAAGPDGSEPIRRRQVSFSESGGFTDCVVHGRRSLTPGIRHHGPAVIEETDSTTLVHPGYTYRVDELGNIMIQHGQA